MWDVGSGKLEVGSWRSEVGCQMSDDRCGKLELGIRNLGKVIGG